MGSLNSGFGFLGVALHRIDEAVVLMGPSMSSLENSLRGCTS